MLKYVLLYHQHRLRIQLGEWGIMLPVPVLLLPFLTNVIVCLVLVHGPKFSKYWDRATDDNIELISLVVYSIWIIHSLTYAVLLKHPRTQHTKMVVLSKTLGRWWMTEWAVLATTHLLFNLMFQYNSTVMSLFACFNGLIVGGFISTLVQPYLFPQLALVFILGILTLQVRKLEK